MTGEGVFISMTAEIIQLKPKRRDIIKSLINKAEDYELSEPEKCIEIQKRTIKMLIFELNRSTRIAKAALKVLADKED